MIFNGNGNGSSYIPTTREEQVEFVLSLNRKHADLFASKEEREARQVYRREHPTEIMAFKCMDGRLLLPHITRTPRGIIQPMRNLGGCFDLGWPFLQGIIMDFARYTRAQDRNILFPLTYHFSKGSPLRGCAGFGYDQTAAMAHIRDLRDQFSIVFRKQRDSVAAIKVGIETDEGCLIFHGDGVSQVLDVSSLSLAEVEDEDFLMNRMGWLYPSIPEYILKDIIPLIQGNRSHIDELARQDRHPLEVEHREWIIGVGRGFDWLHLPNRALLIGPYSPDLKTPIEKAAGIVQGNMLRDRIPSGTFLLLISSIYRFPDPDGDGPEAEFARRKARFLSQVAQETIRKSHPDLAQMMHVMEGVVDMNTRIFHPL